jgi:D-hydroxyproline dehydrogenase subunit beta
VSLDVVVIGAGVIGGACAYFLARSGLKVALVERYGIAAGTSSACTGIMGYGLYARDYERELQSAAMRAYADLLDRGFAFDYARHGALVVPTGEGSVETLEERARAIRLVGFAPEWIDGSALRDAEPQLSHAHERALLLPELAQVSPMRVAVELTQAAGRLGATILTNSRVSEVLVGARGVQGVRVNGHVMATETVVLAAGVWSREIAATIGLDAPVLPVKGHVIATEPVPGLLRHQIVEFVAVPDASAAAASVTRDLPTIFANVEELPTGTLLIGGSREQVGYDRAVEGSVVQRILQRAVQLVPRVARTRALRSFTGLRPWTPDGRPLVGRSGRIEGLVFATGHGGDGITLSVITGQLIGELVLGLPTALDLRPLSPARFGV